MDPPSTVRSRYGVVGSDLYFPRALWPHMDAVQAAHLRTRPHRVEDLADILDLAGTLVTLPRSSRLAH